MAPLLTIPLYQQTRTHENFWMTDGDRRPCFWEFETLANFKGEKLFRHPDSATRNILRAGKVMPGRDADDCTVEITAYSYKGIPRLTYVTKRGRDGNDHRVPVAWIEYVPIHQTVPMAVAERASLKLPDFRALVRKNAALREAVFNSGLLAPERHFRRNLIAFVDSPSGFLADRVLPVKGNETP